MKSIVKKLILAAKNSGADCVKLQIINAEESYQRGTESLNCSKNTVLTLIHLKE